MTRSIVVLNGLNGAAVEIAPLARALAPWGRVFTPDMLGHGGRPLPEKMTMPAVAADLIAYLDYQKIERAVFIGFSLGGLVALYLAHHYPDRVSAVCGIATKFIFDEATVKRWVYLGDTERIGRPGNPRKDELATAHFPEDWVQVTLAANEWTKDLGVNMPLTEEEISGIRQPVRLLSGTNDPVVPVEEQKQLARLLRTHVGLFPGSAHPFRLAPPELPMIIGEWLETLDD